MIQSTDLKNGVTFLLNGRPYKVIKYTHIKIGRGGATVRVTARNLETGGIEEKTMSSNVKVDEINTFKRKLQYLYSDDLKAIFMDPKTIVVNIKTAEIIGYVIPPSFLKVTDKATQHLLS